MKILNIKSISPLTLSIIVTAFWLQSASNDQVIVQSPIQPGKHSARNPLALAAGQIKISIANKPVVKAMPEHSMYGQVEVLVENYAEIQILDENWDEEAYVAEQRQAEKFLTESERASRQVIHNLESKMMTAWGDFSQDNAVTTQLQALFEGNNAPNSQLVDLRCSKALCRLTLQSPNEDSQLELLDALPEQIEWLEQSVAEVTINPDDSRLVTVYLIRPVQEHEGEEPI